MDFTTDLVRSLITRPPPPLAAGKSVGPEEEKDKKKKYLIQHGASRLSLSPICCDFSLFYFYYCIPVPPPKRITAKYTLLDVKPIKFYALEKCSTGYLYLCSAAGPPDRLRSRLSFHLLCSSAPICAVHWTTSTNVLPPHRILYRSSEKKKNQFKHTKSRPICTSLP